MTELDFTCQKIIQETISEYFPSDSFLGEEDDNVGEIADCDVDNISSSEESVSALSNALSQNNDDNNVDIEQLLWIVDPIDGTTNFQSGV